MDMASAVEVQLDHGYPIWDVICRRIASRTGDIETKQ